MMREKLNLALLATSLVVTSGVANAQTVTKTSTDVGLIGGYANNPYGGSTAATQTSSPYAKGTVDTRVEIDTAHDKVTLNGSVNYKYYTKRLQDDSTYQAGLDYQGHNTAHLSTHAALSYTDSTVGSLEDFIASSTIGTGSGTGSSTGTGTSNGSTTDVGLLGSNNRRRSVNFSAGMGYQIDGHSEFDLNGKGSVVRYKYALGANKYDSYGGTAGYARDVNGHVRLGLQGGVDVTNYFTALSKTTVYSGVATIKAKLSERWTLDGNTGFSHLTIASGKGRDGWTASANLCYKSSNMADFCANASRGFMPSGTLGTSIQTSVGGSYHYRLSAKDSISAIANYVKNDNSGLLVNNNQNDYVTTLFGYSHQQTQRLALSVNASYQKVTGASLAQTDDYGAYVTLTYHLGDMH